ncbi:hypothetical protein E2C01_070311 [Portunus trituberculatus]|uniref:Uncharacterized protein n=1 Tax=Portunus trituberculatus TaxID=210409 RepID=A0A5B7HSC8_PORTR|nr:hypothetical protein [Portunus trituberculatus]
MRLLTASFYLLAMQLVLLQVVETQIRENVSEIAPYTVVKEAQTYEERSYPSAHWICHNATLQDPSMSVDSFWPLFGYISGANIDASETHVGIKTVKALAINLLTSTDPL